MFDTNAFSLFLKKQCAEFNLEFIQAWEVAQSIFAASIRDKGSDKWPTTIFYFDGQEVKQRDKDSGEECMAREIQLLMIMGFTVGGLSDNSDDYVRVAFFEGDDPVGNDPINIINYASQLFAKRDNSEIDWPDTAKIININ